MAIEIKDEVAIAKMRAVGALAAAQLEMIAEYIKPGISTGELDRICHEFTINEQQAIPAPLNYRGFPKSICTSVNHVVCHGIPSDDKTLKEGDIVNIDVTLIKDGYHGDTSKTYIVGKGGVLAKRLTSICHECLYLGIKAVKPGGHLGDIGNAIQTHAEKNRFSVVREYCGHGIGKVFHDEPQVLHYGSKGTGPKLEPGMIFTIEPMINAGKAAVKLLPDQWTVVTKDHKLTAQWEHTILVTETGYEILTYRSDDTISRCG
ncbi:MAG: type I methionyl aminopeptidase [Gammaproteobacteria bacterium]|jgi:methionyl aminopeptidase|nr:type I methionyl aminopeptidase [Gammaproteobacteria bacterium]MBT7369890.1 type I methionyl aminopeptidase [Gammaproteobacteria bacterium]